MNSYQVLLRTTLNKITINAQEVHNHFSTIASKYKNMRTLDLEPILHIKNQINGKFKISMADVGCGDGRYSIEFLKQFKDRCYVHCVDYNENMLKSLQIHLTEQNITNFCTRQGDANKLPLDSNSLDYIVTFNAIHHFDISKFLSESLRSLKDGGHLFIYTRLQMQNSKNIWGKYFPLFSETETRLYDIEELEQHIQNADMNICSTKLFEYPRISSLSRLITQAENNHYSTFALYDKKTFQESLKTFKQNIKKNFDNLEQIKWTDENILIEIKT